MCVSCSSRKLDGWISDHRLGHLQIHTISTFNRHLKRVCTTSSSPFLGSTHVFWVDVVRSLILNFAALSSSSSPPTAPYHPSLTSLYEHFATVMCDICFSFIHDPQELHYIAAARWPGFCKPLLDQMDKGLPNEYNPSEIVRMRLNKLFNPTITAALEALLPRLTNATDWALANEPPRNLLSIPGSTSLQVRLPTIQAGYHDQAGITGLPRMSKFILLASFLASTNPPRSDIRMFGRGLDEKKRKRRVIKTTGKGPSKVCTDFILCGFWF